MTTYIIYYSTEAESNFKGLQFNILNHAASKVLLTF
jgi:hypothetical protein